MGRPRQDHKKCPVGTGAAGRSGVVFLTLPTPPRIKPADPNAPLDDEEVRRRVASGELVPMPAAPPAPVDPLVMARLRENAARPLRGRSGGGT
jgi:hypothetical protein